MSIMFSLLANTTLQTVLAGYIGANTTLQTVLAGYIGAGLILIPIILFLGKFFCQRGLILQSNRDGLYLKRETFWLVQRRGKIFHTKLPWVTYKFLWLISKISSTKPYDFPSMRRRVPWLRRLLALWGQSFSLQCLQYVSTYRVRTYFLHYLQIWQIRNKFGEWII